MMLRDDGKLILRCSASGASENELTPAVKSPQASRACARARACARWVTEWGRSPREVSHTAEISSRPTHFTLEEQE